MDKITLGPNQYFYTDDELTYKACCAAYVAAGARIVGPLAFSDIGVVYGTTPNMEFCTMGYVDGETKLTPEQILFHDDAPEWAALVVRREDGRFVYLEHNEKGRCPKWQNFGESGGFSSPNHAWFKAKVIATRPQEHKVKTIDDAIEYFGGVWPYSSDEKMLLCVGNNWQDVTEIGVYTYLDVRANHNSDFKFICTRGEFEARVAEIGKPWVPEVGQECEVSNCGNPFEKCEIKYMGPQLCVVDMDTHLDQHLHLSSVKFRPIKTEREKFIESIVSIVSPLPWPPSDKEIAAAIADSGKFQLKED